MPKLRPLMLSLLVTLLAPTLALAAGGHHPTIPGPELSAVWVIPFACMLLSIAIMPLAIPHIWHHHFGKIAVFWGLAFLVPCFAVYGAQVAIYELLHALLLEYVPFIILLFALFTVAGGVRLKGSLVGTPVVSIWGATHPYAGSLGWGQTADNAVQVDMPCRPCSVNGHRPCYRGDYACLKRINADAIMQKVGTYLE